MIVILTIIVQPSVESKDGGAPEQKELKCADDDVVLLFVLNVKCDGNIAVVCGVIKMCSVVNDELMLELF